VSTVDAWVADIKRMGVKSIICLLAEEHLKLYDAIPGGLVSYYQECGFAVAHLPVPDHQSPPLNEEQRRRVFIAYQNLEKPVLVHCSAGIDRTGVAVRHIQSQPSGAA
jgi:protein-tyrosine phosphatase